MAASNERSSRLKGSTREAIAGYMFIMPWVLGFLLFMGGPILFSLLLSFTK